jgi:phosphonate transport system permease protein
MSSAPATKISPFKTKLAAFHDRIWFTNVEVDLSEKGDGSEKRSIRKKRPIALWIALILIAGLTVFSCFFVYSQNFDFTWSGLMDILKELYVLNPNSYRSLQTSAAWWNYMWTVAVPTIWQTTEMCFIATVFGAIISIPIYYLSARNIAHKAAIYQPVRVVNDLIRTIPTMIFAIFATLIWGTGFLAGIVAMVIFTVGIMYQLMYEYIETLEMSPYEAVRSAGANSLQSVNLGLHPEIKPMFLANFLYTFEINIRASIILGYVGAGGYGYELEQRITAEQYDRVGCLLIPLFILVFTLQVASNIVSRKLK